MLTPEYIKRTPDNVVEMIEKMELDTINDISRRIAKNMELTATADYQIEMLYRMGYDIEDIEKEIAKQMGVAAEELEKVLLDASRESYANDERIYKDGGRHLPKLSDNKPMQDFISAVAKQTKDTFQNFTRTTGIATPTGAKSLTKFYQDTLSQSVLQVGAGVIDHGTAIRNAVRTLGDSGIRIIDYDSGVKRHIESATRTAVLTGLNQITSHMSLANADMMGQDLMEITAHWGARPDHALWQGRIVSRSSRPGYLSLEDIGYGTVEGFKGANCRHDWFPFFEGISERNYTDEQLENFDPPDIEYDGKTYTYYEATQRQRQIERQIRNSQRKISAYEGAGLEKELTAEKIRMNRLNKEYRQFSNAAGIRPKRERIYTYKEGSTIPPAPKKAVEERKRIAGNNILDSVDKNKLTDMDYNIELMKKQKYDGLPKVLSEDEFNSYVKANSSEVIYRGFNGDSEEIVAEYYDSLINGDLYVPTGKKNTIIGSGIYFGNDLSIAERYADKVNSKIVKAVLSKDTKLKTYSTQAWQRESRKARAKVINKAIAEGFDGIRIKGMDMFTGADYISIFNRTSLIISK